MSDSIILEKVTFYKLDDEGNVLLDTKGNERIFTLKILLIVLGFVRALMRSI
jgi:hypothetical protein